MISISNNDIITINKGDSFKYPLFINAGDRLNPVRLRIGEGDTVYLAVCEPHQPFECGVIRKRYTINDTNTKGDVVVRLEESDTEDVLPGVYYFEGKIKLHNNKTYTIIPKRKFIIYE